MARYFVDGQDLTDIADAIREKTGKSANMEFPDEFVSEIEGISSGGITPTGTINITQNGTTDVTEYASANVAVPNSYAAADEGKVVSNGALVAQTSKNISANGTVDTTLNNQVVVAVPNSYSASDEGKVVSNGALVTQGSDTVTANDTYDTTLINSLTVNVSGGGGGLSADAVASGTVSGDIVLSDSTASVRAYAFQNCTNITGLTANGVTTFGTAAFQFCHFNTNKLYLPECTTLNTYVFNPGNNAGQITYLILPKVTAIPVDAFRGNRLSYIDIGANCESIASRGLSSQAGTASVQVLVLRRTAGVTSLANANGFESGISSSTRIYVPSALKSSYQTASNWATRYASYPDLFQNLEGSPYENAYVDGTPISS